MEFQLAKSFIANCSFRMMENYFSGRAAGYHWKIHFQLKPTHVLCTEKKNFLRSLLLKMKMCGKAFGFTLRAEDSLATTLSSTNTTAGASRKWENNFDFNSEGWISNINCWLHGKKMSSKKTQIPRVKREEVPLIVNNRWASGGCRK